MLAKKALFPGNSAYTKVASGFGHTDNRRASAWPRTMRSRMPRRGVNGPAEMKCTPVFPAKIG